jgi:hypothetical protein
MSGQSLWNPVKGSDMSDLVGVFGGMIDFLCFFTSPTHSMYPP